MSKNEGPREGQLVTRGSQSLVRRSEGLVARGLANLAQAAEPRSLEISIPGEFYARAKDFPWCPGDWYRDDGWELCSEKPCALKLGPGQVPPKTQKSVFKLSLDGSSYTVSDEHIDQLPRLHEEIPLVALELSSCDMITPKGARKLGMLSNLTELHIRECVQIERADLDYLQSLHDLEYLTLTCSLKEALQETYDNLQQASLAFLARLGNLRKLNLLWPLIDDDIAHVRAASRLESLALSMWYSTGITDQGLEYIADLRQLVRLDLSSTEIGDRGLAHLCALRRLESLRLKLYEISDRGFACLAKLHSLIALYLVSSPEMRTSQVSYRGLVHLRALANLRHLSLDCNITDAGLAQLSALRQLESLTIYSDAISDHGLVHLPALPQLEWLLLVSEQITDQGLIHLRELANLRELHLHCANVSEAAVSALRDALPNCIVVLTNKDSE